VKNPVRTNEVRWREHGASSIEKAMEIWGLIANGRRWSARGCRAVARGFFLRKSHFGHSSPPFRVGTRSSEWARSEERGILAFSREAATGGIRVIKMVGGGS